MHKMPLGFLCRFVMNYYEAKFVKTNLTACIVIQAVMEVCMDITLERILSLIPKKPDGKYVHGAKKEFAESIGLNHAQIIADWEGGRNSSYKNYLYVISAKYNVSVEWLKGETDKKKPIPEDELDAELKRLLMDLRPDEADKVRAYVQGMIANRR